MEVLVVDDSDDDDAAYDPKAAAARSQKQVSPSIPATLNPSVRENFERLLSQAKMFTDVLESGVSLVVFAERDELQSSDRPWAPRRVNDLSRVFALHPQIESDATKAFSVDNEPTNGKKRKGSTTNSSSKKRKGDEVEASPLHEQSKLVSGGTLKDFQKVGVDWLIARHLNTSVSLALLGPSAPKFALTSLGDPTGLPPRR